MAFKAGAIYGEARLDTKKWRGGLKTLSKTAAVAMAAVAAAVLVYMTKAVKAADEFQRAMSNVNTLLDETKISTRDLTKQILKLDPALGKTTELTNGLYQAFSAGAETAKEAMQTTVDAAKFARAGLTETKTAVDVLTTAVNAYGRENMNTTKASDIFFTTIKKGKITGEELASSIGTSIPLYASAGIKLEELASGIAAMTKQGVKANVATTQLNAIVSAFLKPSEAMTSALKDMGYESGSAFLKAEGLSGALKLVEERTDGDAAAMAELLPNIRALRGVMSLTGVGGEEFTETLLEMENAAGVTQEAFDKQEKTFDMLKNSLDRVQIVSGNIGKHFVDKIAAGATTAANSVLDFLMSTRGMDIVAQLAGYVAAGFTLIKETAVILWDILKKALVPIFDAVKEVIKEVTGETTEGAGGMKIFSIVIGLVSSAVSILSTMIVGGINILRDWIIAIRESAGTVGKFFEFLKGKAKWEEVKEQGKKAGEAFKGLGKTYVDTYVNIYKTVRDEVKSFGKETEEIAVDLTAKVSTAFEKTSMNIKSNWDEMITGQGESAKYGVEDLRGTIENGNDNIEDDIEDTTKTIQEKWIETWNSIVEEGKISYEGLNNALTDALDSQIIGLETFNELHLELWTNHWNDMIDIVSEKFDFIQGVVKYGTDSLASIGQQYRTNQEAEDKLYYNNKLSILESQKEQGLITEAEFNTQKDALDKDALEKSNSLALKSFNAEKRNRIADIWMNAGSAIMGWWTQAIKLGPFAGPIFGAVMSAATTGLAGVQTALVAGQKFVPARAAGGMTSGMTRVNEKGGEIISLPDNSQVIPADISRQIANNVGSQGTVINVSFEGATISNELELEEITNRVISKLGREMRLVG